ncbi:hypothetical protein [Phyllobacterium lublinensis]|nr:hypothetical protein [Phyllobacterium sp. 2063]
MASPFYLTNISIRVHMYPVNRAAIRQAITDRNTIRRDTIGLIG